MHVSRDESPEHEEQAPSRRRRRGLNRRQFLARTGVLGAATLLAPAVLFGRRAEEAGAASLFDMLAPVLRDLSRDTFAGLGAFVVPGPDAYSVAQGVSTPSAGGVAAKAPEFLMNALDHFYPLPDDVVRLVVEALGTGLSDLPLAVPGGLLRLPLPLIRDLGDALQVVLRNDDTLPLSLPIALMLNQLATLTDPGSLVGPFVSPFANLSFADKAAAFRLLEEDTATLVALIDDGLTEPARQSVSGLLKFLGGALLEFSAFGAFSEWGVLDARTRTLTGVPVGWRLTNYLASTGFRPVEGWDELKGYFEGRTEVTG